MIKAYILLTIKPGMDRAVFQAVGELRQVTNLETLYGEYDLLAEIEVKNMDDLDAFVFDSMRTIQGVIKTTTLMTIKPTN